MHKVVSALFLVVVQVNGLAPGTRTAASPVQQYIGRRSLLQNSATLLMLPILAPHPGFALEDLDSLSAPSAPTVMKAVDAKPITVTVTVQTAASKPAEKTPYARIKELQQKGNLTKEEQKELRRLKADEMCEMLGRGC